MCDNILTYNEYIYIYILYSIIVAMLLMVELCGLWGLRARAATVLHVQAERPAGGNTPPRPPWAILPRGGRRGLTHSDSEHLHELQQEVTCKRLCKHHKGVTIARHERGCEAERKATN